MSKNRIAYVDVFRGIGLLLMIAGHVGYIGLADKLLGKIRIDFTLDEFVHAFHMPMFFFVSGYLFRHKEKTELSTLRYIGHKAKTLLIPYAVFGTAHYLIWLAFFRDGDWLQPLRSLLLFNTDGLPIAGALWFLTALFFASVLFFVADRYLRNRYARDAVIVAISVLGCLETELLPFRLPFALGPALVGTGFMLLGHSFRCLETGLKERPAYKWLNAWWVLALGIPLVLVLVFWNGSVNMRNGQYGFPLLFYLNATLSSVLLLQLSKRLDCAASRIRPLGMCNRLLERLAGYAMVVVCCNQLVIRVIKDLLVIQMSGYVYRGLVFVLTVACLLCLALPFYKTRLKALVGE